MTSSFQYPKADPLSAEEIQSQYDSLRQVDQINSDIEEEEKKRKKTAEADSKKAQATQAKNKQTLKEPTGAGGVLREVGTAIVGAGIDAVEGVAGNVQQAVTGQLNNPEFTPTWLQVDDRVEPLNKTWWGNLIRGVGEYGILSAATRKVGGKLPGKAGAVLGGRGIGSELTRGAIVGNLSSQSQGDNASRALADVFPWFPDVLATNDDDHPLLKRAKNTLEGLGMDFVFDKIAGVAKGVITQRRASEQAVVSAQTDVAAKVQQKQQSQAQIREAQVAYEEARDRYNLAQEAALNKPKDDPAWEAVKQAKADSNAAGVRYRAAKSAQRVAATAAPTEVDPEAVADSVARENQAARQANFDELAESRLADDPDGVNGPDPYVNSPLYDANEKPIFSVKKGALEKALLDVYKIDTDPRYRDGRPETLATEAAMQKRLAGENKGRRKAIESVAKYLIDDDKFIGEFNGVRVTRKEAKNLAVARALDTLDEFSDPEDLEAFKAQLLSNPGVMPIRGKSVSYLNRENLAAAELFLNITAGEMADLASAARSVRGAIDTTTQEDMILKRMEFLLKETFLAKRIWSDTGNNMKVGGLNLLKRDDFDALADGIDEDVATRMSTIKQLRDQGDYTLIQHYIDAASISGGKIQTLVDLDRYMKDRIWKWTGSPSEQGGLARGFVSTFVNSVLSGPKTVLRAWAGTSLAVALRPITLYTGAMLRGDDRLMAKSLHQMAVWREGAGEAMSLFSQAWKNHLAGEGVPYSGFAGNTDALHNTDQWKALGEWVNARGTDGDKAGYWIATMMSKFSGFPPFNYSMGLMGAGDAANRTILGRMELKSMAFDRAWTETKGQVDSTLVRRYEEEMRGLVFDKDGLVTDQAASMAGDEAALTTKLSEGFEGLERLFNSNPLLKPFFMFPKTGINALKYAFSFNPLGTSIAKVFVLNSFLKEVDEVMNVTPDTLEAVMTKYGIKDIEAAKAMYEGRVAFGQMTTFAAAGLYLSGGLTGNGPHDKETRNAWFQGGWKPRSVRIGDSWVGYDSLDPFASLLAMVADVGDNSDQMGQLFTETWLQRISYVVAMNLTQKSFLSGLQPLAELLSAGGPGAAFNKTVTMYANNMIPFSSLRKEIAEAFNPGMRELEDNFMEYIANRNPGFKGNLPYKRDVLNGQPLRLYDPLTRFANIISPFQINPDWNETRELLRRSGFDVAFTLRTNSRGEKLSAVDRSKMQNEMGSQGIEKKLAQLFKTQAYLDSFQLAQEVRARGIPSTQWPLKASYHYQAIQRIFNEAKAVAEAKINLQEGNSQAVQQSQTLSVAKEAAKSGNTERARAYADIIQMVK
jgi:hypothetical protein